MKKEKKIIQGSDMKEKKEPSKKRLIGIVIIVAVIVLGYWGSTKIIQNKSASLDSEVDTSVVVATVKGENIQLGDLEKIKASIPQLKDIPMQVVYNQLLEAYINNKVILDQAKKQGLQNTPEVQKALKDAEDQILFQAYLAKKLQERMTPDKLQAIYQQEVQNFVPQDEIRARHILVATQKEANDIIIQLKAGADFATLADKYSLDKDPNALNGGDLGYFTKNMMIPEFADAAFSLGKGKFSTEPVKTAFGWHVIKVEDIRKSTPPAYDEVEEAVKARFAEVTATQIIQEERDKAQVKVFDIFKTQQPVSQSTSTPVTSVAPTVEPEAVEQEEVTETEAVAVPAQE